MQFSLTFLFRILLQHGVVHVLHVLRQHQLVHMVAAHGDGPRAV